MKQSDRRRLDAGRAEPAREGFLRADAAFPGDAAEKVTDPVSAPWSMKVPGIRQAPPGPKAAEVLERVRRFESPATATFGASRDPLVMKRGAGVAIEDADGNTYLDFVAGFGVLNTGHGHPKVLAAMTRQLESLVHVMGATNPTRAALMEALSAKVPGPGDKSVLFGAGGGEAVDMALRLVRGATGGYEVIAFYGAYHGRPQGAMSLLARGAGRKGVQPMLPGAVHAPYPDRYRPAFGGAPEECGMACARFVENLLKGEATGVAQPAAIIVEPVLGNGGMIPAPVEFLQELRRICDETGTLLVADEVMSGWGRTGRFLAIEHAGVVPDVVVMGKAMGGGIPLSAVVAGKALMQHQKPNRDSSTLAGNPVACAAALATLDVLQSERLMENAAAMGAYFLEALRDLAGEFDIIGDVRGLGLMVGVEFVDDRESKAPIRGGAPAVAQLCRNEGLIAYPAAGQYANVLGFLPPLIIEKSHVDAAVAILRSALSRYQSLRHAG